MENENYTGPNPPPDKENLKEEEEEQQLRLSEKKEEAAATGEEEEDENSKMALSDDPTKVKFTNSMHHDLNDGNQNGEAKVEIENVQLAFAGMGKEELLNYADDPFWVKLRWALFILFWVLWAAMLFGAVAIVVTTPGCPPLPTRDWWQKGAIYQVYPKSFMDSNADGIGDLPGIESKLDYLIDLGVNTIWLSPFYKSPMKDNGYDVSDFVDVDPSFGNLDDFKNLLKSAHDKNLYIILDFIPNHSSSDHPWFQESRKGSGNYTDYYIWRDGASGEQPPNNWISVFGNSAWTFDSVRKQYYLHQFLDSQPDLNLRNPLVREELKEILRFWLDLGVDGFRIDAIKHLFEDESFKNEPPNTQLDQDITQIPNDYGSLDHKYTTDLPEVFDALLEWRDVLNSYKEKDGRHRLLTVEDYGGLNKTMDYYGNDTQPLADFPFNFQLLSLNQSSSAADVFEAVSNWIRAMPQGKWPNWVLGNHDVSRVASRTHVELVDAFNMMSTLLGGTPVTYYGEEIGMVDVMVSFADTQDEKGKIHGAKGYRQFSRDFQRTPMQWNSEFQAGFTNASKPWLPVSSDYQFLNAEVQQHDPDSHLSIYKKLVRLRTEPAIVYGELHLLPVTEDIFSFARVKKGSPGYAVLVNFGSNVTRIELPKLGCCVTFDFPEEGIVEVKSSNMSSDSPLVAAGHKTKIKLYDIVLWPKEAVVMKFVPSFKAQN